MNFQYLTEFLDMLADDMRIPYLDCMIMQEHKPIYRHLRGYADEVNGIRATGNELYYIYSISKVMTSAAAMQMYERGKFLFDEPISRYIPAFHDMTVREESGEIRPMRGEIRIRDLFCMCSGLPYDMNLPGIRKLIAEKEGRFTTREFIEAIAASPACCDPGTDFNYGFSMDVIAYLVEVLSDMPFGDYMKKYIFEPCGMERSTFDLRAVEDKMIPLYDYSDADGCAHWHRSQKNPLIPSYEFHSGGAGVISCVEDSAKFADAMACNGVAATGKRILTPASIRLIHQNQLNAAQMEQMNLPGYGYGCGVRTFVDPARGGGLGTVGEFGWSGAAGCYIMIDPERHIGVFYGQHMFNNKEHFVHRRIRNLVYTGLDMDE